MNALASLLADLAHAPIEKRAITNHGVLNEAFAYAKPSSFSRGMRIDLNGLTILLISGTASIDENGVSVHIGNFRAQMRRTLDNITGLLSIEGSNQALSLLGHTVELTQNSSTVTGQVSTVQYNNGSPTLTVTQSDGTVLQSIDPTQVTLIQGGS